MRWNIPFEDQDRFDDHGTLQGTVYAWVRSNASGAIPLAYQPRRENANGRGSLNKEFANLHLQMRTWDLLSSRFDLAPEFQSVQSQIKGLTKATAPVRLEWHSDGLELKLTNSSDVELDLSPLGQTHRWGYEGIRGSLAARAIQTIGQPGQLSNTLTVDDVVESYPGARYWSQDFTVDAGAGCQRIG